MPQTRRGIVARRHAEQREGLALRASQRSYELTRGTPASGVDGRPDEDHRPDAVRSAHRELGDDLTAKGIRDDCRANQIECIEPLAQYVCELTDPAAAPVTPALPLTGEIGHEDR